MKKIILSSFLIPLNVLAAPINISKEMPQGMDFSLFESAADGKVKSLSPLAKLKYHEIRKQSGECNSLAPVQYNKHKDLRGWVALSWLRCNGKPVVNALDRIAQDEDNFRTGHWQGPLWSLWLEQSLALIDAQVKSKNSKVENRIQKVLLFADKLSAEQKSILFRQLGEVAQQKKDPEKALFYFQQSMGFKVSPAANEKVRFLQKVLGQASEDKAVPGIASKPLVPEQQLEERYVAAHRAGETIVAIKQAVEILNSYPGSGTAKKLKDKPLELYLGLFDRSSVDQDVLDQALDAVSDADSTRLVDWSQTLHRRADYRGALKLVEKSLKNYENSATATGLLWIAGRSAHFLGQYDKAIGFYDELSLKHRGSDEAGEALFRMGLIQYRLRNDSTAVVLFDKVIEEKRDRYELSARYWLYRSLQREKSPRAEAVRKEIIEKYPFSYYGIRLHAETQNNKVKWPQFAQETKSTASGTMWLEAYQLQAWKRFSVLLKNGWVNEAQSEWQDVPKPQNAQQQVQVSEALAKAGLVSLAIRWVNEAMDQDLSLRSSEVLSIVYPQPFKDIYEREATRHQMSPRLLMSLTRQESAFNLRAVSSSNALGLMQLIPPTAREVAQKLGYKKLDLPEELFRPETNIAMGSFYVADMLKQFQFSVPFALAAYNAGPTRVNIWSSLREEVKKQMATPSSAPEAEVWFDELPWSETSFYVKAILRNVLLYRLVSEGEYDLSPVVWSDLVNKKPLAQ